MAYFAFGVAWQRFYHFAPRIPHPPEPLNNGSATRNWPLVKQGGRHANIRTSRAMLMHTDGSTPRELGAQLIENDDSWTQFARWSPD